MANVNVSNETELADAILNAADGDTITFTADIVLTADLPAIQTGITIDGAGYTLYGTDPNTVDAPSYRGFFVYSSGADGVVIEDLTISGAVAEGGAGRRGGGGGAGMGGALFVTEGATVTVIDVAIVDGAANGGNGNDVGGGGGGAGGGMGGEGGLTVGGGGGGIGTGADGAVTLLNAGDGIVAGALPGGDGVGGGDAGLDGGGGGGGSPGGSGGGGGIGGGDATATEGGDGGFGGGGGGAVSGGTAGDGGFGGGGGSGSGAAGDGGYGGGGGRSAGEPGTGGFGGGDASTSGAGMGGAVFVMEGGTLIIAGSFTVSGNTVQGGDGLNEDGQAFGSGLYLEGSGTLTFSADLGDTQTVEDDIADEQGVIDAGYVPPDGFTAGSWNIEKTGAGTLILSGTTTIGGELLLSGGEPENTVTIDGGSVTAATGTTVESGTLELINGGTLVTGVLLVSGAMTVDDGGAIAADGIAIDASGAFYLGLGGLAGTLSAATIANNGSFVASFTDTATISAVFSGNGTLIKDSAGTLILTGASDGFVGATNVNGGVLQVDGSLSGSAITVNDATLGGNGSTGKVTVKAGGVVSAGASAGKLTTGTLTYASSSATFKAELGGTSAGIGGYDQVVVNGSVILGGAVLEVSLLDGYDPSTGTSYTIIANDGADAVSGTFSGLAEGEAFEVGSDWFTITYAGGDGNDVLLTAVEEPPDEGVAITGTDGANTVDATQTVSGQPLPTEFADLIDGLGGKDDLSGLGGDDSINGGRGGDALHGDAGGDSILGKRGCDTIDGGDGDDTMSGGSGGDRLDGGAGNDTLNGGRGKDLLTGGEDNDTFVFANPNKPDKVTDFAEGDIIALAESAFHGIGPTGVLKAKYFAAGDEAETPNQKILYDEDSGWLFYAKNGWNSATTPHAFAEIGKHLDIDHTDFLVI